MQHPSPATAEHPSAARHRLQGARLQKVQHVAGTSNQPVLTQVTQHARKCFRSNAQLRRNEALALVQGNAHGAAGVGLRMFQEPLGTAGLGILNQPAHRKLRLLATGGSHVAQQCARLRRKGLAVTLKIRQEHTVQLHPRLGKHIDSAGQIQQRIGGIQPAWPFNHSQLMAQMAALAHAQNDATAVQVQHRCESLMALPQDIARSSSFGLYVLRKK